MSTAENVSLNPSVSIRIFSSNEAGHIIAVTRLRLNPSVSIRIFSSKKG